MRVLGWLARFMPATVVVAMVNGVFALGLAVLMWRITHSLLGWLALFVPGSILVLWGCWLVLWP
jgi:hypothetical protein